MTREVLFLTAPWCEPCRQAALIFSEVVAEFDVVARFVDVDLSPDLADTFSIDRLPTILVRADADRASILTGSRPKAEMRTFIADALGSAMNS